MLARISQLVFLMPHCGLSAAPKCFFADAEPLSRRPDLVKKAGRISGISGGCLELRQVRLPEIVKLAHEQFAQVFAAHGSEGHAKMVGIRPRPKSYSNVAPGADDAVAATFMRFFLGNHHPVRDAVLNERGISVPPAVLVHVEPKRLAGRRCCTVGGE